MITVALGITAKLAKLHPDIVGAVVPIALARDGLGILVLCWILSLAVTQ